MEHRYLLAVFLTTDPLDQWPVSVMLSFLSVCLSIHRSSSCCVETVVLYGSSNFFHRLAATSF